MLLKKSMASSTWDTSVSLSKYLKYKFMDDDVSRIKKERQTRLELATPTLARSCSTNWAIAAHETLIQVKRRRLELPRPNCHYPLKVARLPIPPPLQHVCVLNKTVPRTGLEPARRKTHAPETCASTNSATWANRNPQASPWSYLKQRAANETRTRDPDLGKVVLYQLSYCRITLCNEAFR